MDKKTKDMLKDFHSFLTVGELGFSAGIAADIFAEEARSRVKVKTGKLKGAIVSRINKTQAQFGEKGSAYVGVDYKKAPHGHLVEYGARGGKMPAQPYIRPSIDVKQGEAIAAVEADISRRILKRFGV
ncbi:MAG: HK97 gp10 family phage protein [Proteobacteria bacterium]|nr:HK97 gp10 family phage protein [Pseudomonadota bacterium]